MGTHDKAEAAQLLIFCNHYLSNWPIFIGELPMD